MSTTLLDLSVLTKTFGSQRVIDQVAFQMKRAKS